MASELVTGWGLSQYRSMALNRKEYKEFCSSHVVQGAKWKEKSPLYRPIRLLSMVSKLLKMAPLLAIERYWGLSVQKAEHPKRCHSTLPQCFLPMVAR
ncbi:hypothetical protein CCP4SC76_7930003 [Gammaproteobacteria bacterium]